MYRIKLSSFDFKFKLVNFQLSKRRHASIQVGAKNQSANQHRDIHGRTALGSPCVCKKSTRWVNNLFFSARIYTGAPLWLTYVDSTKVLQLHITKGHVKIVSFVLFNVICTCENIDILHLKRRLGFKCQYYQASLTTFCFKPSLLIKTEIASVNKCIALQTHLIICTPLWMWIRNILILYFVYRHIQCTN